MLHDCYSESVAAVISMFWNVSHFIQLSQCQRNFPVIEPKDLPQYVNL